MVDTIVISVSHVRRDHSHSPIHSDFRSTRCILWCERLLHLRISAFAEQLSQRPGRFLNRIVRHVKDLARIDDLVLRNDSIVSRFFLMCPCCFHRNPRVGKGRFTIIGASRRILKAPHRTFDNVRDRLFSAMPSRLVFILVLILRVFRLFSRRVWLVTTAPLHCRRIALKVLKGMDRAERRPSSIPNVLKGTEVQSETDRAITNKNLE